MRFRRWRQRAWLGMRWDDRGEEALLGLLDDLEMQAEGLHLAERAVEVGELSVAQYAEVELVARLHASIGAELRVGMIDDLDLRGRLARVGADWLLLEGGQAGTSFVHLAHVAVIAGLVPGTVPAAARPLSARLSLRSVLRGLAEDRQPGALHVRGGRTLHGIVSGVGADFVELDQGESGQTIMVPLTAVAVVQRRSGAMP